jgi:cation diffusion facilitator CzcD-associated flavoprotein CzcO
VTVTFVGGGFAGLVTGARLKEAGIGDVRIVEKGGGFGGTWYWNRYPGAQRDTSAMIYMPLLEETGHMPSERYAHAPEIRFQRTPSSVDVRDNRPIDPEWFAGVAAPGWQECWLENFVATSIPSTASSMRPASRSAPRPRGGTGSR